LNYKIKLVQKDKQIEYLKQYFHFVYKEEYIYIMFSYLINIANIDYIYKKFKSSLCQKNL